MSGVFFIFYLIFQVCYISYFAGVGGTPRQVYVHLKVMPWQAYVCM